MDKDRQIVSELRNFFTENGCGLGVQRIMNILGTINITERQMAFEKKPNCKFTCAQVIQMMILFPFFSIKNAANYVGSSLQPLFDCHKDMFYRVLSNDRIDWRHILRYVNKKLVNNIAVRSDAESNVEKRKEEYFQDKISSMKKMLNNASIEHLGFDYLLVDSWFTCKEVVNYIRRKGSKSHLLGMIKMGKTKYTVAGEDLTARAIASAMVRKKAVKYSRAHKFYYFEADAIFAGKSVKLFFYRFGRKGEWKALLSTNTSLTPYKAYQIYSMRWSIEVSFHDDRECHSIVDDSESEDVDVRIAVLPVGPVHRKIVRAFDRY